MRRLTALTVIFGCTSCSWQFSVPGFGEREITAAGPNISQTLKKLPGVPLLAPSGAEGQVSFLLQEPDPAEVLALYQSVLDKISDAEANYHVARRVAELQLQQAEDAAIRGEPEPYGEAVAALERLLIDENSTRDRAYIQYQLARAYDLNGDPDASIQNLNLAIEAGPEDAGLQQKGSDQGIALEARFRRAELKFSAGKHAGAAEDYAVVAASPGNYQVHALYMLGWSRFKQGDLNQALLPFVNVLDHLLGESETGARRDQDLIDDATRVAVLTLDYLDGANTLAQTMQDISKPDWQTHLYKALGDWYRDKERFQDSADTWETFIDHNPLHVEAPRISLQIIETYRAAGFVEDIADRKQQFVERYDRLGSFYDVHGPVVFETYADTLMEFLDEILSRQHAIAQMAAREDNDVSKFREAADWYGRWIVNFTAHERAGEVQFLLAESLSDGGLVLESINAYRVVVNKYPDFSGRAEASYSIVLGFQLLAAQGAPSPSQDSLQPLSRLLMQELIDASFDFVALFPADKRSPATQVNGARMLFETGRFQQAAEAAEHALSQWDLSELWTTAALISAHSRFELGHYSRAEQTYRSLLAKAKSDKDGSATEITQRLLATVYKQAEAAELSNDLDTAIDHLLALQEIDASSELAINAAYDTVALFEQVGQIDQAINHLKVFRRNHPLHPATHGIAMRLVALYERENRFEDSANELIGVHASTDFPADVQQQALYRAGELYLSVENYPMAIDSFRIYAHSYERPFGLRMEAMHHMDLLYQQTNQTQARYFWLGRKVDAYRKADAADQDERTRFLAVQASFIIAESRLAEFHHLDLKQPLKKSLQKKRKAMKLAVDAFERTSDFGVAGFVEGSTFHIADIYQSLAQSLMESDRPNGLNALESDQYDILLEEQAFPFEEQAIDIHLVNLHRGWNDAWNNWVGQSLTALETLSPGRYRREEIGVPYVEKLY